MRAWWSRTGWIWTFYALGLANLVILAVNWSQWGWAHRLLGVSFLVLMAHVTEEWFLPGGFHVQYNTLMHSDQLDRYPMSRLTDSLTVVAAMALGLVIIPVGGPVLEVAMATFACVEVLGHTIMGTTMHKHLAPHGKRTIYGPGTATAYTCYLPLAVALFVLVAHGGAGPLTFLAGIGTGLLYGLATAFTPEVLFKSTTSRYPYTSSRYYARWDQWLTGKQPERRPSATALP